MARNYFYRNACLNAIPKMDVFVLHAGYAALMYVYICICACFCENCVHKPMLQIRSLYSTPFYSGLWMELVLLLAQLILYVLKRNSLNERLLKIEQIFKTYIFIEE